MRSIDIQPMVYDEHVTYKQHNVVLKQHAQCTNHNRWYTEQYNIQPVVYVAFWHADCSSLGWRHNLQGQVASLDESGR